MHSDGEGSAALTCEAFEKVYLLTSFAEAYFRRMAREKQVIQCHTHSCIRKSCMNSALGAFVISCCE